MTLRGKISAGRGPTRRGLAAVEFAVVLPLLVITMLGVWDLGRLIQVNQVLTNVTREAARQATTGNSTSADVQTVVSNGLARAGIPTTGVTTTVTNLTNSARSDPTAATQLDQYQISVTLPSSSVRLLALGSLIGTNTLKSVSTWMSMVDIPLAVSATIPVN